MDGVNLPGKKSIEQCGLELPHYRCHKQVWALKIDEIRSNPAGTRIIVPADPRYKPFVVDAGFVAKHNPVAGGYIVYYEDGYQSYSPAKAFEEGYTLISA